MISSRVVIQLLVAYVYILLILLMLVADTREEAFLSGLTIGVLTIALILGFIKGKREK